MNSIQKLQPIARSIVRDAASIIADTKVLIWYDEPASDLADLVEIECNKLNAPTKRFLRELEKDVIQVKKADISIIEKLFEEEKQKLDASDHVIILRGPRNPEILGTLSKEKYKAYFDAYEKVHAKRFSKELNWTLFYYPTEYEADKEEMEYARYFDMCIAACDQKWDEIKQAQEILINEVLDPGRELVFLANHKDSNKEKRTHVTMSIENMTFVNSTIDNNYPGSEVFSAPVKTSINGHIYADGVYIYGGKKMTNIYLDIVHGKIVKASAEKGNANLQEILSQGPGARYFGEVALGTNPGLTKRMFNSLLNEKVGGSFHMAVGHCYTFDTDGEKRVNVNNGNLPNTTPVHWDITIMMRKEYGGGEVMVDGKIIQENGIFLDPRLSILNNPSS